MKKYTKPELEAIDLILEQTILDGSPNGDSQLSIDPFENSDDSDK